MARTDENAGETYPNWFWESYYDRPEWALDATPRDWYEFMNQGPRHEAVDAA